MKKGNPEQAPNASSWNQQLETLQKHWGKHEQFVQKLQPYQWDSDAFAKIEESTNKLDEEARLLGYACLEVMRQGQQLSLQNPSAPAQEETAQPQPESTTANETAPAPSPSYPAENLEPSTDPKELLIELIEVLGSPEELNTTEDILEELDFLEELTHPEELAEWEVLPDDIRVKLMEHLAARARALQLHPESKPPHIDSQRIGRLFGRMADHLKKGWPGHAHGLALNHTPRDGSWQLDARERLAEIEQLLPTVSSDV